MGRRCRRHVWAESGRPWGLLEAADRGVEEGGVCLELGGVAWTLLPVAGGGRALEGLHRDRLIN